MPWRAALILLTFFPSFLHAQSTKWELETYLTDSVRAASLKGPRGRMTIYCGEVLSDETSLYEEVNYSGPGHFNLLGEVQAMGEYDPSEQTIHSSTAESYIDDIPPFYFDEIGGTGWVSRVPFDHPLITQMMRNHEVSIIPQLALEFRLSAEGLGEGLREMKTHCSGLRPNTQAKSQPNDQADAVATTTLDPALSGMIQAQAFSQCQAAYELPPSAIQTVDVTGDGIEDAIVDFGQLRCVEGIFANHPTSISCAGEMCRHDIYSAQAAGPIILYAKSIVPDADRMGDIHLAMDAPSCSAMSASETCKVRSRWMSQTFATIGVE